MKIIEEEDWSYTLFEDEIAGNYFLEAVCGTIGVFNLTICLTADEIDSMASDPSFVKALAAKITYSPSKYLERRVPDIEIGMIENEL